MTQSHDEVITPAAAARGAALLALAASVVVAIVLLEPWAPVVCGAQPDFSFALRHHFAFLHSEDVSKIYSTHGPWGFAFRGYHPATYVPLLMVWVFLALALASALFVLIRERFERPGLTLLCIAGMLSSVAASPRDAAMLLLVAAAASAALRKQPGRTLECLLGAALGLTALIKFSIFVAAATVVLITATHVIFISRRFPVLAASFAASLCVFWVAANQPLRGLWPYIRNSWELSASYAEGASMSSPGDLAYLLLYLLVTIAPLIALAALKPYRGTVSVASLAVAGAVIFFLFKMTFVRADEWHLAITSGALPPLALVWVTQFWDELRIGTHRRLARTVVAVCSVALIAANFDQWQTSASLLYKPQPLESMFARCIADSAINCPMPGGGDTSDMLPYPTGSFLALQPAQSVRPIVQSYMAWSEPLARRDADHFSSPHAPERLFVRVAAIDRHLPLSEDGPAWIEIVRRYGFENRTPCALSLRRRAASRAPEIVVFASGERTFHEQIAIPAGRRVIFQAEIEQTPPGRMLAFVYKVPSLTLRVRTADGDERSFNLPRAAARSGFLINPLILDDDDLQRLFTSESVAADRQVTSISIESAKSAWLRPRWRFTLSVVDFARSAAVGRRMAGADLAADRESKTSS